MAEKPFAEVFPPGEFIQEELDARGWTQEDFASIIGKPLAAVNEIIKGKRSITAETAVRIAAAFGTSPHLWMNLESGWQIHLQSKKRDSKEIRTRARIYETAPVREMQRRGWMQKTRNPKEIEKELISYYGVTDLSEVPRLQVAARASNRPDDGGLNAAQWAWCIRCCQIASLVDAKSFSKSNIKPLVKDLHSLLPNPEDARLVPLLLAEAGIKFVVVEHLSKTRMDGAALWPSNRTPVIAMSLRYGRVDNFWFTLLHELAHICYRDGVRADIDIEDQKSVTDNIEKRANKQSASWLVPQEALQSFILRTSPLYSTTRVTNFARRMGVHPSIIVGQLKFCEELEPFQFTRLQNIDVRKIIKQVAMCDGWGRPAPVSN